MTSVATQAEVQGTAERQDLNDLRVLIEIVHPADVLFFLHPIRRLRARGATVIIASRHKDLATQLLDSFSLEHKPLTRAARGALGLALELVSRDYRLWRIVRRDKPDVMAGFGGVAIAHVGALARVPTLSFYDSEHASLQIKLARPFVSEWHVPACWDGVDAPGRLFRFEGYKELSYFHPRNFIADKRVAAANGWREGVDCFFVRVVDFRASHDFGKRGLDIEQLRRLVAELGARGDVVISAEVELPDDLRRFEFSGDITSVHHVLAQCRLYIGESATMAAEAAVLGVPAIFTADFHLGYIEEMQQAGMVRKVTGPIDELLRVVAELTTRPLSEWQAKRDDMLAGKINVADYVVENLVRAGRKTR